MNKEPRQIEVVVDFVDRVHGTGFQEIRPWRLQIAIPVEFVDVGRVDVRLCDFRSRFVFPVAFCFLRKCHNICSMDHWSHTPPRTVLALFTHTAPRNVVHRT